VTPAQRRVLEHITGPRHLSFGGENHWYFNGESVRIHANTGFSLQKAGWIAALPRLKNQPFWRTDYDITPAGRRALAAAQAGINLAFGFGIG
jgi:hypothetical protein